MQIDYKKHLFMGGQTIRAVIRKYNQQTNDEQLISTLMNKYFEKNGPGNPRIGNSGWVPFVKMEIPNE